MVAQWARDNIYDVVRLAVAVLFYSKFSPDLAKALVDWPPLAADSLSGIAAAICTLVLFWILHPVSTVEKHVSA